MSLANSIISFRSCEFYWRQNWWCHNELVKQSATIKTSRDIVKWRGSMILLLSSDYGDRLSHIYWIQFDWTLMTSCSNAINWLAFDLFINFWCNFRIFNYKPIMQIFVAYALTVAVWVANGNIQWKTQFIENSMNYSCSQWKMYL